MNKAIKSSPGRRAETADAAIIDDDFDYEAIEQAVMETPRGRRFLREYLKRHREADSTRLMQAMQRLSSAVEERGRAREQAAAEQFRALVRDVLAEAATALADLQQPGTEPPPPGMVASRMQALLAHMREQAAREAPRMSPSLAVLREMFASLAAVLGEPRPRADALPESAHADIAHAASGDEETRHEGPRPEHHAPASTTSTMRTVDTPSPANERDSRQAAPAEAATPRQTLRIAPCAPRAPRRKHGTVRIQITRRQHDVRIPMPGTDGADTPARTETPDTDATKSESSTSSEARQSA